MSRLGWVLTLGAAALATGCFTEPEKDEGFSLLPEHERVPYARTRVERANQAIAGGATMVALGLAAIGTGIYLAVKDRSGDCVGCGDGRTLVLAYAGGGLIGAGIPIGAKGLRHRGLWEEFAEPRPEAKTRAGVALHVDPGGAAAATLYLPAGEPVPPGGEGLAIVRVAGPADPAVARLAARVPALRWPVLEQPAPGVRTTLAIGPEAVEKALATTSREVLH